MSATKFETWEVGGCLRDEFLGIKSKDVDFSVVGPASLDEMVEWLESEGFEVMTTKAETFTAVCKVPASKPELLARTRVADFVMARKESSASTGRMPDSIVAGTLLDDLSRRDFTVNAWARNPTTGEIVDPFGGRADLEGFGTLRFVGEPMKRIREDALRVARGFRFLVTKGFDCDDGTWDALTSPEAAELLSAEIDGKRVISTERLQVEMDKMFLANTPLALGVLADAGDTTRRALFPAGLRLSATMKA